MKEKMTLFVSHHPGDLLLYKNFITIRRVYDKYFPIILVKVNHPYYAAFDLNPYKEIFDEVIELPFIAYQKNIVKGIAEMYSFNRTYKKIQKLMREKDVTVFMGQSAWLPINVLLFRFTQEKAITRLYRWDIDVGKHVSSQTQKDHLRTLYCNLYRLFIAAYEVEALTTVQKKFVNFSYVNHDKLPGKLLYLSNPTQKKISRKKKDAHSIILPYPLIRQKRETVKIKKNMVVIFGDAGALEDFREYIDNYKEAEEKLKNFFKSVKKIYRECALYYKPHPADKDRIMPGIHSRDYRFFSNATNAQGILDKYHSKIRAVYTVFSTSVLWSAFFGIPSYTCYRFIYNKSGIKRFNEFFGKEATDSPCLWNIADIKQIGKIDDETPAVSYVDLNNIAKEYQNVFDY